VPERIPTLEPGLSSFKISDLHSIGLPIAGLAVELPCVMGTLTSEMEVSSMKLVGMFLLLVGVSGAALASAVPEIDPGSSASALTLLSGALLVIKSRRKK